jgi:hypothetical protein
MTKAKIGDQRFKKKSYIPYIVAVMCVIFTAVGVFIGLSAVFHKDNLSGSPVIIVQSRGSTNYAAIAESLWRNPTEKPDYLIFMPATSTVPQNSEFCFMLQRGPSVSKNPASVRTQVEVDDARTHYFTMQWDEPYCFSPRLEKGYHLIKLNAMSVAQWGILVE